MLRAALLQDDDVTRCQNAAQQFGLEQAKNWGLMWVWPGPPASMNRGELAVPWPELRRVKPSFNSRATRCENSGTAT